MIQNAPAVLRHVKVRPAVAVVVSSGHAHSIATAGNTRFLCDIRKRAVAIVTIKCVTEGRTRRKKITLPAVNQINVHPTVVVVVQEGTARPRSFGQIVIRRASVHVTPCDSGRGGRHFFKQWPGRSFHRILLRPKRKVCNSSQAPAPSKRQPPEEFPPRPMGHHGSSPHDQVLGTACRLARFRASTLPTLTYSRLGNACHTSCGEKTRRRAGARLQGATEERATKNRSKRMLIILQR